MNFLKTVFWDYPQLTERDSLRTFIRENRNSEEIYSWLLMRFLEFGRVVDAFEYFPIREISNQLPKLKLSPYTRKKWKRIIEVYG